LDPDSIFVFDQQYRRLTVLDTLGALERTRPLELQGYDALVLPHGALVTAALTMDPAHAGQPIHYISKDTVMSFGNVDGTPYTRTTHSQLVRGLARSAEGFWAIDRDQYRLQLWNTSSRLLRAISVEREWFKPIAGQPTSYQEIAAQGPSQVLDVVEDGNKLWVSISVANPRWVMPSNSADPAELARNRWICVMEVLDSKTGDLLASRSYPFPLRFAAPGFAYASEQDRDGIVRMHVVRLAYSPRKGESK
jgi:hypothetical protein